MKRIKPQVYVFLILSVISLMIAIFFIFSAVKTEPFDYYGVKYIEAIREINIHGEAKSRVIVVKDATNGDIEVGKYIVTLREFDQGFLYVVEQIVQINGTNGQIQTTYTSVFEAYITVSDIQYVFNDDANAFETTLFLLEKPERAIIFAVLFLSATGVLIYLTVKGFLKKKR